MAVGGFPRARRVCGYFRSAGQAGASFQHQVGGSRLSQEPERPGPCPNLTAQPWTPLKCPRNCPPLPQPAQKRQLEPARGPAPQRPPPSHTHTPTRHTPAACPSYRLPSDPLHGRCPSAPAGRCAACPARGTCGAARPKAGMRWCQGAATPAHRPALCRAASGSPTARAPRNAGGAGRRPATSTSSSGSITSSTASSPAQHHQHQHQHNAHLWEMVFLTDLSICAYVWSKPSGSNTGSQPNWLSPRAGTMRPCVRPTKVTGSTSGAGAKAGGPSAAGDRGQAARRALGAARGAGRPCQGC
jgi:hypothetical protein